MRVLSHSSPLVLASGSPRRRQLLESVGIPLRVLRCEIDEDVRGAETPDAYLERIVAAKLAAAQDALRATVELAAHSVLLVADTTVTLDGEILGKPTDPEAGARMIAQLAGRAHEVKTRFGIAVAGEGSEAGKVLAETVCTRVFVRALSDAWIERYARCGEGDDKAGGYAVQGRFAFAIERIEGSYANVVGLPLCEVVRALDALGLIPWFLSDPR